MAIAIEFSHIRKSYGDTVIIPNLNLQIEKGEFVTIVGSSGCGKTTALKMINGLYEPTSGDIFVNGENISSIPIDNKKEYSFLRKDIDTIPYSDYPTEYQTNYYISYDGKEEKKVELSDLIHFIAPLKKGENTIEVSYTAFPEVLRDDFLPQFL